MSSIIIRALILLSSAMLVLSFGCSDVRSPKPLIDPDTGKHDALWESPDSHGAVAKGAASATTGFAVCQECHADNFIGGISYVTCLNTAACHGASVSAPHSPKPWRGGTRTHIDTDQSNAPVCALCHTNGANSSLQPSPFDPGVEPGCFNNTLCHAAVGHPEGWDDPDAHGATAKSAPSTSAGFSYCQTCHGNDFAGGIALQTCLNTAGCHGAGVNAPHSPKPWRGGTRTHTTTDINNASTCATCHTNGANSSVQPSPFDPTAAPGCFNNTLCHAAVGHAAGWSSPDSHGAAAKSAPSSSAGFSYCQTCHGNDFTGGTALQTCLNTAGCHGEGVNAPHAASWLPGDTYTHSTTNVNNASVCGLCHLGNRTPPAYETVPAGTAPNCFDNTLCHAQVAGHVLPFTDSTLHGPAAKSDLTYCQACHSDQPTGGAGSNPRFNVPLGSLTNGCEDCHAANTAHAIPWTGVNATSHQTAGNMDTACRLCHGANFEGGVGPACTSCHKLGSPLTMLNCSSCHGKPPTGSVSPDVAGKHGEHDALVNVTGVCDTCHNGAGTGTAKHYDTVVDVAFLGTTYNAKSGSAAFNAAEYTCSNISCHGGSRTQSSTQAGQNPPQSTVTQTPSWLSGTINVGTDCKVCHVLGSSAGNPENNSYYSGMHWFHVYSKNRACTDCHDTTKLSANHFTTLNTSVMEGPASETLNSSLNYNGTSCNPSCHGNETW
jgi:predicted CxxxxCH...CXXCH cytochrome family protein